MGGNIGDLMHSMHCCTVLPNPAWWKQGATARRNARTYPDTNTTAKAQPAQLRQHIERQFVDGMTWDAFNQGDIHIDHIIPKAAFDLSDFEQWRKCWCMSNLRPLWAKDNVSKGEELMFLV